MNPSIIVDSDAIFALFNPNDPLNEKALQTFRRLTERNYQLIYPTSVIFEVISLFQRVLPNPEVLTQLVHLIHQKQLSIFVVDQEILQNALNLFNPKGSKKHTLIDCSVAAIARHVSAAGIFSYDRFYTKHGFQLAENVE